MRASMASGSAVFALLEGACRAARALLAPVLVGVMLLAVDCASAGTAQSPSESPAAPKAPAAKQPTPEEQRAAQRFPQPVRVSDLVGRPVLDENSSIMGYVRAVVRTTEGKVQLLMPLGGLFGLGTRLVPIPVESVAMLGAQVAVVDMPPHRFNKTPTWYGSNSEPLAAAEIVHVGVISR
jgi:hypothetical protein